MDNAKPKYYLTTPIYYANSRPHVGSAYTTIVCDVIARYKRMCGYDVAYLTGTDEHGVNIERAAEKLGISPADLVDRNQQIFRDLWKLLGIQFTHFIRTTETRHARAVQNLVRRTLERDKHLEPSKRAIYKAKYEGRYCIYDNLYVSDTPEPANCQICGRPAELISEENYFFRLSAFQDRLLQLYQDNPEFIQPSAPPVQIPESSITQLNPTRRLSVQPDFRRNEVISFVKSGLKDISISRKTIKWGIPWPDDPEHVFYVWYDALTSYMSGIGFVDGEHDGADFKYWPADVHMIGKEIIRFHAVYWPAFLMAAELPLPKEIRAHGWLLFEQEKMSKSKGNVAYAEPIVKVLGNDALRYYLLRETVFGQDGNFSREALITRYNADLANGLGNLASRVLTMINQYFGGNVPRIDAPQGHLSGVWDPNDFGYVLEHKYANEGIEAAKAALEKFDFSGALGATWFIVSQVDQYLTFGKPWTLAGKPDELFQLQAILYRAAEALRIAIVLAHPVIPDATQKIWEQLGQAGKLEDVRINELQWGGLEPGTRIGKPEGVFPRADKKEVLEKIEAMENEIRNPGATAPATSHEPQVTSQAPATSPAPGGAATAAAAAAAAPAKIAIEDFAKVELRVGVVKSAERIQGADKLLKLLVDVGDEVR